MKYQKPEIVEQGSALKAIQEMTKPHGSVEILESKSGGAHFRVRLPMRQNTGTGEQGASEKAHAA